MLRKSALCSFVVGGTIGAVAALLFAPKKGEELREQLFEKGMDILTDSQGIKESVSGFVSNIKNKEEEFFNDEEDSDIVIKRDFSDEEFKNEDLSKFNYNQDEKNQQEPEQDVQEDEKEEKKTERSSLDIKTNYQGTQTAQQKDNENSAGDVNKEALEREEQNEVPENKEEQIRKAVDKANKETKENKKDKDNKQEKKNKENTPEKNPKQDNSKKEDKKDDEKIRYQDKGFKNQPHITKEDEEQKDDKEKEVKEYGL